MRKGVALVGREGRALCFSWSKRKAGRGKGNRITRDMSNWVPWGTGDAVTILIMFKAT